MRYIYFVAAVLLLSAILVVVQFVRGKPAIEKNPAIIINDRVITVEEFAKLKPPHDEFRAESINAIITRELLIQEAQKEGIDKEEPFRRSIQTFYEQSLVKVLMDRKYAGFKVEVSDEEINRYSSMLDKKVSLTIYSAPSAGELKANKAKEEKRIVQFGDLSRKMRNAVALLKKGEKSAVIETGSGAIQLKLDDIRPGGGKVPALNRDEVRRLIAEEKRENLINEWMEGIRKKAKIKVLVSGTNGG